MESRSPKGRDNQAKKQLFDNFNNNNNNNNNNNVNTSNNNNVINNNNSIQSDIVSLSEKLKIRSLYGE